MEISFSQEIRVPVGDSQSGTVNIERFLTVEVGELARDFTRTTIEGEQITLSDLAGKVVLLDFWATWCAPCVAELPNVKKVLEEFGGDGEFVVVGISLDEDAETVRRFVEQRELPWHQIVLGPAEQNPLARQWGVDGVPATFFVGRDGKIFAKDLRGDDLRKAVADALAGKDPLQSPPQPQLAQLAVQQAATAAVAAAALISSAPVEVQQSVVKLRGVHQACVLFAQTNDGKFPSDVGQLVVQKYVISQFTIRRDGETQMPFEFGIWSKDKQRAWINQNSTYVLVPGLSGTIDGQQVALFERPAATDGQRMAVCFNDNHVEWLPIDEARRIIEQQTGKTLEQLIQEQAKAESSDTSSDDEP